MCCIDKSKRKDLFQQSSPQWIALLSLFCSRRNLNRRGDVIKFHLFDGLYFPFCCYNWRNLAIEECVLETKTILVERKESIEVRKLMKLFLKRQFHRIDFWVKWKVELDVQWSLDKIWLE